MEVMKIMKKSLFLVPLLGGSILLAGCGPQEEVKQKEDFYIKTQAISGFTNQIVVQKSAKLESDQNIMVTAQANGRVNKILVKDGDTVKEWQIIVQLKDDVANYGLAVQRAKTALNSARLQYKNAKIALGKGVADSKLNVERSKNTLLTAKDAGVQSIKHAEQNLNSAGTKLATMKKQFDGQKTKLLNVFQSVIDFSDKLLGVTTSNEYYSQWFQHLLSAKDTNIKVEAKTQLRNLISLQTKIQNLKTTNLSNQELLDALSIMQDAYNKIDTFLLKMIDMMNASVDGVRLPMSQINSIIKTINEQKKVNQTSLWASFEPYKAQVNAILWDASNPGKNTLQESAKIGYETTKIQTEKNIFDANLAVKNAEKTYTTAVQTQTTQLQLLATNIKQAEIAYQDALTFYGKLTIKSPINGVVGNILVDKWQEIRMGTPMFSISNEVEQLLDIYVSSNEYKYLKIDALAKIKYDDKIYTGTVNSISSVASRNGLYKVKIAVKSDTQLLGGVADIVIPVEVDGLWLPVNMVTIVGENVGYIRSYDNKKLVKHTVELGEIWGNNVKILNTLTGNILITSDLENYEPEKYTLMIK